jgi:hypothetical protein
MSDRAQSPEVIAARKKRAYLPPTPSRICKFIKGDTAKRGPGEQCKRQAVGRTKYCSLHQNEGKDTSMVEPELGQGLSEPSGAHAQA